MGVCNCSMFCRTLLYVHSGIAIILKGKRKLVALLNLSSWCLVMVEWLILGVSAVCDSGTHYFLLIPRRIIGYYRFVFEACKGYQQKTVTGTKE